MKYLGNLKRHARALNPAKGPSRNIALIFALIFVGAGSVLLVATRAATSATPMEPENGTLTSPASVVSDAGASGGKAVKFGSGNSGGNPLAPMQLLNRRSDVKVYPSTASAAGDSDYATTWQPGSTGTASYDLSAVPAANRQKIILAWYTGTDDGYSAQVFMNGDCANWQRSIAANYTIDVNSAPGATSAPTSGWVNAVTVTNNIFFSRQHLIDMINPSTGNPYNWIRLNITSSVSGLDMNIDLADASQGVTSDWFFAGDSITTLYGGHSGSGPGIADLVATAMGSSYHLVTENAGVACSKASDWNSVYSSYSSSPTIDAQLPLFPGKYVTLNLGTNDSWDGGGDPSGYMSVMQSMAQKVIAAGKTPVIPHIPWPNNGDNTTWDNGVKAYNAKLDQLIASNPNIIAGPDLYAVMKDHPAWFQGAGNVHPSDTGVIAMRCAWAYAIAENVYKTTPAPISSCSGYANP